MSTTPRPTDPGSLFSAVMCKTLHFPCRFVSDHPCCQYRMPLNMAARHGLISRVLDKLDSIIHLINQIFNNRS